MTDEQTVREGIPCARPDWHYEPCKLCAPALAALDRLAAKARVLDRMLRRRRWYLGTKTNHREYMHTYINELLAAEREENE